MSKMYVKEIARKWYQKIGFPKEYDTLFEKLLEEEMDLACMPFAEYDLVANRLNKGKNLIMFLYFCEELAEKYSQLGIPESILMRTLEDLVISVRRQFLLTGQIGIVRASALENHLSMKLFRIGRLQFAMTGSYVDIPEKGIRKGDPVMDVHIPAGEPMTAKACADAFQEAEAFFVTYFPEYQWQYYTCFSWLLDDTIRPFLKEGSNILKFQKLFEPVHKREQDSILQFMFKYGLEDREELRACPAEKDFARKVKEYALAGGVFYNVLGIRDKKTVI